MNPSTKESALKLVKKTLNRISNLKLNAKSKVVICPPFVWLESIAELLEQNFSGLPISLGAQNVYHQDKGAYTGAVSPLMLKDIGVQYVLIGHSETKRLFKEDKKLLFKKTKSCLKHGLTPIIFIGEETKNQNRKQTLKRQLSFYINNLSEEKLIFVYEPVWAISTTPESKPATAKEVKEAVSIIHQCLESQRKTPILYGGSTDDQNINKFLELPHISGVVPGSASLEPRTFSSMIKSASDQIT